MAIALAADALVSLADLKTVLTISESTFDDILNFMINAASEGFQRIVGCNLVYATRTAVKVDGNGGTRLRLPHWPVVSISALTENDVALTENTDYYLNAKLGVLIKGGVSVWSTGLRNIVATYISGYKIDATVPLLPYDIRQAIIMQAGYWWKQMDKEDWGQISQSFGDGSSITLYSIIKEDLLPAVRKVAEGYHRPRV